MTVIRPIDFDEKRKAQKRKKARDRAKRKDQKRRSLGGDLYYHSFSWHIFREPWFVDPVNDNEEYR